MLTNPFSGKELYCFHEHQMTRLPDLSDSQLCDEAWDMIGKQKKQAWNNMAKMINSRMQSEVIDGKAKQTN